MLRFNRNVFITARYFGSGKANPNAQKVPQYHGDKQIRDKLHIKNIDQSSLDTLYQHPKVRKTFTLYNLFSYLPTKFVKQLAKLTSDPKVILRSQNMYLPKLSKNGVPVYDSISKSKSILLIKSAQILVPFMFLTSIHFYAIMTINSLLFFGLYKKTYFELAKNLVVKMQLVPQSQELLIQKVGNFGRMRTLRVNVNDLEHISHLSLSTAFYRSTRSYIDKNLIFRVKSTQELLMFDPQGTWYEEGINHQLLV